MAKKKIDDKKIIVENEEVIIDDIIPKKKDTEKSKIKNNDVILEEPEKKSAPSKLVKIKLKEEHKCHIGGEWYVFHKGKQYNVPEEVKDILNQCNLLMPV